MDKVITVSYDAWLDHFSQKVISLTGSFSYSCKYRQSRISFRDVVDQFLDQYRFAYPCTSEETNFTPFGIRFDQVDYLDTGE